jgi:hypothetical protein
MGYGPFSLCIIHKESLCPTSGGINRLIMMKYDGIDVVLFDENPKFE